MNLYQASQIFFSRSSTSLKRGLWLSAILMLLTAIALKRYSILADTCLITLIALLQVSQMWLKYRATYWYGRGDEPRRMEQFRSGLGLLPSAEKCAAIEQLIGPCTEPIKNDYWFSVKPPGAVRMVEMILESSFSTRFYAGKCRKLFWTIGGVGVVLCVVAIVIAYQLRDVAKPSNFAVQIVLTIFVFFLTGDFWILGAAYGDLTSAADEAHLRAFHLLERGGGISEAEALEAAMNYNTATAQSPPLLSGLYRKNQDQVDVLFKRHFGNLLNLPGNTQTES
jgi:hypothetical protein